MTDLGDVESNWSWIRTRWDLIYDSTLDKFKLVDPDVVLSASVEDNDLPDDFISQLEDEINLGNVQLDEVDGGGFV